MQRQRDPLWRSFVTREVVPTAKRARRTREGSTRWASNFCAPARLLQPPRAATASPCPRFLGLSAVYLAFSWSDCGSMPMDRITTTSRIDRCGCPLLVSQWHRKNRYFMKEVTEHWTESGPRSNDRRRLHPARCMESLRSTAVSHQPEAGDDSSINTHLLTI